MTAYDEKDVVKEPESKGETVADVRATWHEARKDARETEEASDWDDSDGDDDDD